MKTRNRETEAQRHRGTETKIVFILCAFFALFLCHFVFGTQLSFNSGQLSRLMKYRVDVENHSMSVEELENIIVEPEGMAFRRPGTEFIDDANDVVNVRIIPFEYSTGDSYVLEFGHEYIGFLRTTQ